MLFSVATAPFYIPTDTVQDSSFSTPSPTLDTLCLLDIITILMVWLIGISLMSIDVG